MKKKIIYFFVFLVLLSVKAISQVENIAPAIQQIFKEEKVVGLSVAVVKDNKVIYTNSFGSSNLETGDPLTNKNIFRIASISKLLLPKESVS